MEHALIDVKQNWIESIKSHIVNYGFQEVDNGFECIKLTRQPGQTISINGRVMQQPGKEIEIKHNIYFIGDGWVANMDDTNKVEFTQVVFESYQNGELSLKHEEMFYWDEPKSFINMFHRIFG